MRVISWLAENRLASQEGLCHRSSSRTLLHGASLFFFLCYVREIEEELCEVMASWNTGEILNSQRTKANQPQWNQVIMRHVKVSVSIHSKSFHSMRERSGKATRLSYRTRSQCGHHHETRYGHYSVLKFFKCFFLDAGDTSSPRKVYTILLII